MPLGILMQQSSLLLFPSTPSVVVVQKITGSSHPTSFMNIYKAKQVLVAETSVHFMVVDFLRASSWLLDGVHKFSSYGNSLYSVVLIASKFQPTMNQ